MKHALIAAAALVGLVMHAGAARADAVLETEDGDHLFPERVTLESTVDAQVETTTVLLEFAPLEGDLDYVLSVPSPKDAHPIAVDLDRGDGFLPARMLAEPPPAGPSGAAGDQGDQDAIDAWLGTTPLHADLADLGPGPLRVRVRFLRLLRRFEGAVTYQVGAKRCPLRPDEDPGPALSLSAELETARPLDELAVTGSAGALIEERERGASARIEEASLEESEALHIAYRERPAGIDVRFLAHRAPKADPLGGEAGYFLLLVGADMVDPDETRPRTLNLVLDRSGSMSGDKIAQARGAARAMLDNLRPGDRFNILSFNDGVKAALDGPRDASAGRIDRASSFIKKLEARGSTNLNKALLRGLDHRSRDDRYDVMVFLSDGLPTAGVTDRREIFQNSLDKNRHDTRIYTFSVGFGADVPLLEALSRASRGKNYFLNEQQAATEMVEKVRELFEDLRAVRLTDLRMQLPAIQPAETLPKTPPDLFGGGQVIVVGRYRSPGSATVTIQGDEDGVPFERAIPIEAPAVAEENGFIKYVWAGEKVGALLADMAQGGDQEALKEEIIELGLAYRIQTPYTSFSSRGGGYQAGGAGYGQAAQCQVAGPRGSALLALILFLALYFCSRTRSQSPSSTWRSRWVRSSSGASGSGRLP